MAGSTHPPRWAVSLGLTGGWEGNPRFLEGEAQPSLTSGVRGTFSFTDVSPRGRLTLAGQGGGTRYAEVSGLNELTYGGSTSGAYRLGRGTTFDFGGAFNQAYTHGYQPLTDQGLLLPQSLVRNLAASVALSQKLSSHTTFSVSGAYQRALFDDPSLSDGASVLAESSLSRQLGPRSSLSFSYSFVDSIVADQRSGLYHTLSLGWNRPLARRIDLSVKAGVARSDVEDFTSGDRTVRYDFQGGGGLAGRWKRTGFTLRYDHTLGQAYGYGRERMADLASTGFSRSLARRLDFLVSYGFGWSRELSGSGSFLTHSVTSSLTWGLGRHIALAAGYNFWRTRPTTASSDSETSASRASSSGVYASLSYAGQWR
jgi:hypothetical protein